MNIYHKRVVKDGELTFQSFLDPFNNTINRCWYKPDGSTYREFLPYAEEWIL